MCAAITCEQPYPITAYAPCTAPALCALIGKLLEKDPAKRPASAQALLVELHEKVGPAGAPLGQRATAPQESPYDWQMLGDFGKGAWHLAFNSGPAAVGLGLVAMAALWTLSTLFTITGLKQ